MPESHSCFSAFFSKVELSSFSLGQVCSIVVIDRDAGSETSINRTLNTNKWGVFILKYYWDVDEKLDPSSTRGLSLNTSLFCKSLMDTSFFCQKILMPPWWVYKNHGERSDLRLASFLVCLTLQKVRLCGCSVRRFQSHHSAYYFLRHSFYQVLVIVQRDGVELNSFCG